MTPEEFKAYIVRKLLPKYWEEFKVSDSDTRWAELTNAVGIIGVEGKLAITNALATRNKLEIGKALYSVMNDSFTVKANNEASVMMSDNSLNWTEVQRILG